MHDCKIACGEDYDQAGHVQESGHDTRRDAVDRDYGGVVRTANCTTLEV